jgi:hypothetical protein
LVLRRAHLRQPHGLNRSVIGGLFVTTANQLRCGDGGGFGNADHLEHEDAIENLTGGGSIAHDCVIDPYIGM